MIKRPLIYPSRLLRYGQSVDDTLTIKATGLIMQLYELDGVKPRHIRTYTDYDGNITHSVTIAYFSNNEKTEADAYLKELREQFPNIRFEIISTRTPSV